ncbi:uncharacterized protein FIBRA_01198 [Fibroporia radiculosa]|uniref:Protein kinase domain-containing protein n=1 Tax=Fibroporia radiculosa TaxID=599839 RepID=J4G0U9_9APHY|nr:uncharacterized protein FIBRA_01198 [Fibroporia radiculosa]CCL99183.1 predicted protein [Fibroporia radiculosa]
MSTKRAASSRVELSPSERLQRSDQLFSKLTKWEIRWRDRQSFLQTRGYMLRPRYRPGWNPSWRGSGLHPRLFEDSIALPFREHLIDATRISDSQLVYIKRVKTGDNESRIAINLSAPSIRDEPDNHCVPILDTFQDIDDDQISYIVMPFLRLISRPPCETVEDVVDLVDQLLEGLVFLHKHGVAHRDCSYKNIMMDAALLFPQGHHPVRENYLPDGLTPTSSLPRTGIPIKYYYVDFGISVHIPPDQFPKLALGAFGRDQEVPELSTEVPYDPFKVDIFIIGNVFRREFHDKISNIDFLVPLIQCMIRVDPALRPGATETLTQWKKIRSSISGLHRQWRLRFRDESLVSKVISDTTCLAKGVVYVGRRVFEWTVSIQG